MIARDAWADGPAGRLRLRWTVPAGDGPWPWVMYLPGYAAGSLAFYPELAVDPLRALLGALDAAGYATVRAEKRGYGGGDGAKAEGGFEDDHDDLRAALAAVRATPWAQGQRGVLLGHSLGGLHAPRLAAEAPEVRAVALYGVGWLTWDEYLLANQRRVLALAGVGPIEAEQRLRALARFNARVLHAGIEPTAALAELEVHAAWLGVDGDGRLHGRAAGYWREVQACPVAAPLLALAVPVLAMWGASDWQAQREEHVALVDAINAARPGGARYVEVAGADHDWRAHATPEAAMAARGAGDFAAGVAAALVGWLAEVSAAPQAARRRSDEVGELP
jgi:pimeloyl-ACP methyl ester carboxylesterase